MTIQNKLMTCSVAKVILGSRSPRRRELLGLLIPPSQIEVLPPLQSEELGFDGLHSWPEIEQQIQTISRIKNDDVTEQLKVANREDFQAVLTADTVIVGAKEVRSNETEPSLHVLGQPDTTADWQAEVRGWFTDYLWDREHWALTAVCLVDRNGKRYESVVKTSITFNPPDTELLDWYLETEESIGKAGGYAVQERGSLFVKTLDGSLSNVIGLPLETVKQLLSKCEIK